MQLKYNIHKPGINSQNLSKINNLLFDLGGVIIDVDLESSVKAFQDLGFQDFDVVFDQMKRTSQFDLFETGKISAETFRNQLREHSNHISDSQIDFAWNTLLGEIPSKTIDLICNLRKHYRTFLLSNTNTIHIDYLFDHLKKSLGVNPFDQMFERYYLSYEIGYRKPDIASFQYVLDHSGIKAEETFFIDDTLLNVEAANKMGIVAHQLLNESLSDLFEEN